ncbi:MAG TPA: hypothetical protein VGV35_01265 [Bryobacteraceae bacterium]|nr:hypothetical protein [Bryobacteraceae bacterium]
MSLLRLADLRRRDPAPKAVIENLESRQLLSAGPLLTNVQLLGAAKACTGVVLYFNESLDPATAQNAGAFSIGRIKKKSSSSGLSITDFLPFAGRPKTRVIKNGKVHFVLATYDDSTHSITLTPAAPFAAWKYFRAVRIRGTGPNALLDVAGNPFDGNGDGTGGDDAVITWKYHKGKSISFRDADGDHVTIRLKGKGELFSIQHPHGAPAPMVFISDGVPGSTIVSGKVKQSRHGDGIVDITELSGISSADITLLQSNPQFQLGLEYP